MNKTGIEYLDYTWNPIAMRCTPVSDGCRHCWHLAMANRLTANPTISREEQLAYAEGSDPDKGPPVLRSKELEAPLYLKKASRIGVQFMGDLFHESIPDGFLFSIFGIMASEEVGCHSFFVLTKRPKRMADWLNKYVEFGIDPSKLFERVWLGVSVSTDKDLWMVEILLQILAAKRFVSVEPMLGSVKLSPYFPKRCPIHRLYDCCGRQGGDPKALNWIICGGLSLPGGKVQPPRKEWIDSLVEQCDAAGVPMFIKPNAKYPVERKEFPRG